MLFLKCVGSNTKLFMRDVVTCAWRRGQLNTKSLLSVSLVIALLYMTLENTH